MEFNIGEFMILKNTRLLSAVFLSVLMICACSKKDSNPVTPGAPTTVFPLAVGNQWIMQGYIFDVASNALKMAGKDTLTVGRDTTIQGETWYSQGDGTYMSNRTGGLWQYNADYGRQLYFKYPAQVNDTYSMISGDAVNGFDTASVKVISINQSITVPAGTFSCISYQWIAKNIQGARITYQVAPGKGPVYYQMEGVNPLNSQWMIYIKSELIRYSIK
jgi:hypothetical protein